MTAGLTFSRIGEALLPRSSGCERELQGSEKALIVKGGRCRISSCILGSERMEGATYLLLSLGFTYISSA